MLYNFQLKSNLRKMNLYNSKSKNHNGRACVAYVCLLCFSLLEV